MLKSLSPPPLSWLTLINGWLISQLIGSDGFGRLAVDLFLAAQFLFLFTGLFLHFDYCCYYFRWFD